MYFPRRLFWRTPMKRFLFIFSAIALSSCNANNSNTSFVGPTGQATHTAKCSSTSQGCFQEASKICSGPYQVVDSESHAGGMAADLLPGPVTWYGMTYICGKSDGKMPQFPFRGQAYVPDTTPHVLNCNGNRNNLNCTQF